MDVERGGQIRDGRPLTGPDEDEGPVLGERDVVLVGERPRGTPTRARDAPISASTACSFVDDCTTAASVVLHLSGEYALLDGEERGGAPGGHADLGVDVLDVVVGGLGRDAEPVGRPRGWSGRARAGGAPRPPGRSARRVRRSPSGPAVAGGGEDPLDGLAVEAAGARPWPAARPRPRPGQARAGAAGPRSWPGSSRPRRAPAGRRRAGPRRPGGGSRSRRMRSCAGRRDRGQASP